MVSVYELTVADDTTFTFPDTVYILLPLEVAPVTVLVANVYPVLAPNIIVSLSPVYIVAPLESVPVEAPAFGELVRLTVIVEPVPALVVRV